MTHNTSLKLDETAADLRLLPTSTLRLEQFILLAAQIVTCRNVQSIAQGLDRSVSRPYNPKQGSENFFLRGFSSPPDSAVQNRRPSGVFTSIIATIGPGGWFTQHPS